MRVVRLVLSFGTAVTLLLAMSLAQTSSTSQLTGDVLDESGAVVTGGDVVLTDVSTNIVQRTKTNQAGHYSFSAVQPGQYRLTVSKAGFRQTVIDLTLRVGVAIAQNVTLQVGTASETVEVRATGAELQTEDASVGNVISQQTLESLPSLSRDVTALLQLQPMAAPSYNAAPGANNGEGDTTSGGVAGALNDQNTFSLDGGDATSNTEGDAGYANSFQGTPHAAVPTPVESIEEFRVTTNNSNTFARSSGADVQIATRRGSNAWHGSGWEYNQNTDYNGNLWQLKNEGKPRPVWQDNRFGGRLGGPIIRDKAFFFLLYEGRHFQKATPFTRLVPSAQMRAGILQFRDATGAPISYNFAQGAPTAVCAGGPCDPRGKGISPIMSQMWNTFEPTGNNPGEGDGLNTIGFDGAVPNITKEHDGVARFDYNLSQNWTVNAVARSAVADVLGSSQIDIGGLTGGTKGVPKSTDAEPTQPRYYVLGLTGRLSSNMTNEFHVDYLRYYWQWHRKTPFPQVSGLGAALQVYAESNINGLVPMNVDTQNARSRVWDGKETNFRDDISWLRGSHVIQFGGSFRHQNFFHVRDDKVVGGLAAPLYFAEWTSTNMNFGGGVRPTPCNPNPTPPAPPIVTNCLQSADTKKWDQAYAAMMGMIDHTAQLLTRGPDLSANPPGTPNRQNSLVDDYDLHVVDTWHITPTFTLSYGLDWGVQTPPYENSGLQTIMVYAATKKQVVYDEYMKNLAAAALAGQPYAPELGFMPIRQSGRKYPSDIDWHNFAPRLSIAWSPRGESGWLSSIFGDQKSVIRAGYGRYFDRLNGVGLVMTPALGIGFGNGVQCKRVKIANTCGGAKTDPSTAFRIGVDGNSAFIPSLNPVTAPVIPGVTPNANTAFQTYDFRIDPHRKTGVEDTWTLSMQRQVSSRSLVEIGYVGRRAIHLYGANDISQIPYMFTKGGQTFASAYDKLQKQLNIVDACTGGGKTPAGVTIPGNCPATLQAQPFLEATYPGGTVQFAADNNSANSGLFDIGDPTDLFDSLNVGLMPFDQQFLGTQISTSQGASRYNAGYLSFRQQAFRGLMFQANYTYSHSLDDAGLGQASVFISPSDGFDRMKDYHSSLFDRRHVFTGFFVYDLPFGQGHNLSGGSLLNKIIGGWQFSSAMTASSGLGYQMTQAFNSAIELGDGYLAGGSAWIPTSSAGSFHSSVHYLPAGTYGSAGPYVMADPTATLGAYRAPLFSDKRLGGTPIVGFPRWNMDSSLTKTTKLTERVSIGLQLQGVNVFNHTMFQDIPQQLGEPGFDLSFPQNFGKITTQYNTPRFLNIGIRVDF